MSTIDVEKLLAPVSAEDPCGPDLSYDPLYLEIETAAAGKPEQQVGETVIPAEEPDWKTVRAKCVECLARSKDLRVVMNLTMALLKLEGLAGLRDGLTLLRGTLEKYWDKVHPQLDPEDGNDPLLRINILSALTDPVVFRRSIREAPLARSKMLGRFGLRDIEIATGEAPAVDSNGSAPDLKTIEGAFADTTIEDLQAAEAAAGESLELAKAVDGFLTKQVGASRAINFRDLEALLGKARSQTQKYLVKRGAAVSGGQAADDGAGGGAGGQAGGAAVGVNGSIRTRQDVISLIDKICDWYAQNEPNSPVPLLMKRAQRLVSKNFLEIIKDLTPESMRAIQTLAGIEESTPS